MSSQDDHLDVRGEYLDKDEALQRLSEALPDGVAPDGADRQLASLLSLAAAEQSLEDHPDDMLADLRRIKDRERGVGHMLRSLPTPQRLALAVASILATVGAFRAFRPRPDWVEYPEGRMWIAAGLFGGLAIASLGRSLRPMHRPLPRAGGLVAAGVVVAFGLAALPAAHSNHHASLGGFGPLLLEHALHCLMVGIAAAAPLFVLARWLDRGAHSALSRVLLAAGAAGLAANAALQMTCPVTAPVHLLLGHAPVGILLLATAYGIRGGK